MTDYRHMAGFKMQGQILMLMLQAVDSDLIINPSERLIDQNGNEHQCSSNKEFVMELLKGIIIQMFPNLNSVQVESFVIRLFNTVSDWNGFKVTLRDLLVSMKKFASADNELYREEKEVSICIGLMCVGGVKKVVRLVVSEETSDSGNDGTSRLLAIPAGERLPRPVRLN